MRCGAFESACGLLLAVVTACSTSTAGTPSATGVGSAQASSAQLAPPIPQPLDASAYLSRPCDLVTASQLAAAGAKTSGKPLVPRDQITGPGCNWDANDFDTGTDYSIDVDVKTRGLDGLYRRRDNFGVFQPTQVAGYPAVHAADIDTSAKGQCQVLVGINDTMLIAVFSHIGNHSPDYTHGCSHADAFAAAIISNLKAHH